MSFVGTRAEAVKYVKKYKPEYMATLLLPAGITSEACIRYKDEAKLPLVKPYIAPAEEMMPAIEKILYSGYIAESEPVWEFQNRFGEFIGNPNVLMLNSGTAALHIAMLVLNIGQGDEVISTPMTSEPTNTTIALTGAKIVWADVDPRTGLLDPKSAREGSVFFH